MVDFLDYKLGELELYKDPQYLDLLGKPFLLGGRGPNHYDCWGICLEIGRRVKIQYPTDFTPTDTINQDIIIQSVKDQNFIKIDKPEPFCIVTFKITPPFIDHCGIIMSDCRHFLHTMSNHSVTLQRLDHKILLPRLDGFYRLKTNADN